MVPVGSLTAGTPPVATSVTMSARRRSLRSTAAIPETALSGRTTWLTVTSDPLLLVRRKRKRLTLSQLGFPSNWSASWDDGCSARRTVASAVWVAFDGADPPTEPAARVTLTVPRPTVIVSPSARSAASPIRA